MKVILLPGSDEKPWDGVDVYAYELGRRLARMGHEVLGIKAGEENHVSRVEGNYVLKFIKTPSLRGGMGHHLRFQLAVFRGLKDLLEADLVHAIGGFYASVEAIPLKRKVVTIIGASTLRKDSGRLVRAIYGNLIYRFASAYIVPNPIIQREVERVYRIKGAHVIPIGVDLDSLKVRKSKAELRSAHQLDEDDLVVLYVGQLVRGKRLPELIRAFNLVKGRKPKAKLVLTAWGYLERECRELVKELKLSDSVIFIKPVPYHRRWEIYGMADVFAMIGDSFGDGGVSSALLDAMGAGLPAVVARGTANCLVVKDGYNGYSVDPTEVDEVAEAILRCLEESEGMGRNSKELAKGMDWNSVASRISSLYEGL
jgi:glycosyltransferase involved in cell wall biosynthesis